MTVIDTPSEHLLDKNIKIRLTSSGKTPDVLADIYKEVNNFVIWQRPLPSSLRHNISQFLQESPPFQRSLAMTPEDAFQETSKVLGSSDYSPLALDISQLVDMFCCLFDLTKAGVRLAVVDKAMCPKFHVDQIPCRLVTTYHGPATEWLLNHNLDRTKLGRGSNGLPDSKSGLYRSEDSVQQLNAGDVALLKGETWPDNENAGLIHRSPAIEEGKRRLLMTIDAV